MCHNSGYSMFQSLRGPCQGAGQGSLSVWGRCSESTGKSLCSHSERICLLDLCDTSLGFVLPPGEVFRACQAGWRYRIRARTCWNDLISHQFMDRSSGILEKLEKVARERMALAAIAITQMRIGEKDKINSAAWFGLHDSLQICPFWRMDTNRVIINSLWPQVPS